MECLSKADGRILESTEKGDGYRHAERPEELGDCGVAKKRRQEKREGCNDLLCRSRRAEELVPPSLESPVVESPETQLHFDNRIKSAGRRYAR